MVKSRELIPIVPKKLAEQWVRSTLDSVKNGTVVQRVHAGLIIEGAIDQSGEGGILFPLEIRMVGAAARLLGFGDSEIETAMDIGRRIELTLGEQRRMNN